MATGWIKTALVFFWIEGIKAGTTEDRSAIHDNNLTEFLIFGAISICCVLFGGLMSGLTIGLLGIDEMELEMKLSSGTPEEKSDSRKVLSVLNNHHLLLVTLLLSNSIAMEALPLFLDEMFNTEITIIISVTFVLTFGEIIPQSIFTGKNQLKVAKKLVPFVRVLMIILLPLSYPIAKILDCIMEHNESSVRLKPNDLKTFISMHESFAHGDQADKVGLEKFQITMMHGIIDLNRAKVKSFMLPYKQFAKIDVGIPISKDFVGEIVKSFYQYLPIFKGSKNNVVGVVNVQELFKIWEGDTIENSDIIMTEPVVLNGNVSLLTAIKQMEAMQSTMAFILDEVEGKKKVIGVITKEVILNKVMASTSMNERMEIANISHALVDSLEKNNDSQSRKKIITPLRENLL